MILTNLPAATWCRSAAEGWAIAARRVGRATGTGTRWLLPSLGIVLASASLLSPASGQVAVLVVIIVFGVPHGALDGEIVRPVLRPVLGPAWFAVWALPYLGLSALVLLSWNWLPIVTLAAFLGLSMLHFGLEDAGPDPVAAVARGGLPIALPVLLHPAATAAIFGGIAGLPMPVPPHWLVLGARLWAVLVPFWLVGHRGQHRVMAETAFLVGVFVILKPLTAFALYFVCFHGPSHMRALVRDKKALRVTTLPSAVRRSIPVTLLTVATGAALWPIVGTGAFEAHLLSLTIRCLAALTLPHMLLDALSATTPWRRLLPTDRQGRMLLHGCGDRQPRGLAL